MVSQLFGNEMAEDDELLRDCYVSPTSFSRLSEKPILVGRWGSGKTAMLYHVNQTLSQELAKRNREEETAWHLSEKNTIDEQSGIYLRNIQNEFGYDKDLVKRILERLWRAEITRGQCLLLSRLWEYYGSPTTGRHWSFIAGIAQSADVTIPIWRQIPKAVPIALGEDHVDIPNESQSYLVTLFDDVTLGYIKACLRDVANREIQPVLAVEPIDTPESKIEEIGLSDVMITALLNVYRRAFMPSPEQPIKIHIAIPWHRFVIDKLDAPQHLSQFIDRIVWGEDSLREFINRRVEWEFRRTGRSFRKGPRDAWYTLFGDSVLNDHCEGRIYEDSFCYVLRHTHYRPRDLMHFAREVVEGYASSEKKTLDSVLIGRRGEKISASILRETLRRTCPVSINDRLMPEIKRRYPGVEERIKASLTGIAVPFTLENLAGRIDRANINIDLLELVDQLWTSGIIGVEITPKSEQILQSLRGILGREGFRQYTSDRRRIYKWYFFEYNWDGKPIELINRYAKSEDTEAKLVLHPRTFEYLQPTVSRHCPIGA